MTSEPNLPLFLNNPGLVLIAGFLFSLLVTWLGIPSVVRLARIKGLYDMPGSRASHVEPTPRLGGAMIFGGVVLSSVLFTSLSDASELKYIIAGLIILFFIGVKDDIYTLVPIKKMAGQIIAALIIVALGNIRLDYCYDLFGIEELSYIWSLIISVFLVVGLINSINLIDGIDGLASGVGIIASVSFGLWYAANGHISYGVMCFSLTGSLLAFFWYNVFSRKYKTFLGDTGSMLIGFLLAVFTIDFLKLNEGPANIGGGTAAPSLVLAILIVPVFDTLRTVVLRVIRKKPVFVGDKNHIHHGVLRISKSHLGATATIIIVNIILIAFTWFFRNLGNAILVPSLLIISATLTLIMHLYLKKTELN
jgi:UDP-GlcNAc:undecaprenyl-phosphate/decaprenyl-phosphate GlcNAc-1-phosphate transferase